MKIKITLEQFCGHWEDDITVPGIIFPDGDCFPLSMTLADFLMHCGIRGAEFGKVDEFYIEIPEAK